MALNTNIRQYAEDGDAGIASLLASPATATASPAINNTSVRDALAAQLRAQYDTGQGGSGSWDDAGYDRAIELADLLINAGVTDLGELSFQDLEGDVWDGGEIDSQGNVVGGKGWSKGKLGRQLMIGDKAVGYLGDYNNDGTYGSKAQDTLKGIGDEALLGWSARGSGNTSYRVVTDPNTGKLIIVPGWNSSSDASDFRKAGVFLGGAALGGAGISGALAGAAGLGGTAGGAALSGAATGAGLNMATTQDISTDTLKAGALGGLGGYLGYLGGDLINSMAPGAGSTGTEYLPGVFDSAGNPVPLNMAAIESGLGTPGYGYNTAAAASGLFDPTVIGSGAGLMYGPGGTIIPYDPAAVSAITANDVAKKPWDLPLDDPNWEPNPADYSDPNAAISGVGDSVTITAPPIANAPINAGGAIGAGIGATLPTTNLPYEQTVDIETSRLPPEDDPTVWPGDPFVDSIESNPTNNTDNTTDEAAHPRDEDVDTGQNDPHNDNLDDPTGTGPGSAVTVPGVADKIIDWITKNPKVAITLLGSLLGGDGDGNGGGDGGGGGGTPIVGGTATPAAPLGRRYVAPPPGYRPGFDPEHRYFTGIGATGPTPPVTTPPVTTPPGTPGAPGTPGTPGYVEPFSVGPAVPP